MNKYNRGRRGATLAELAIVIAVIAIVAVMVTSFIVLIDGSRDISQMKLEAMQDIVLAESVIENFIIDAVTVDHPDCYRSKVKLANKEGHTLTFTPGTQMLIVARGGEGETSTVLTLETVENIEFFTLGSGNDILYYCTITYNVGGDSNLEYTFCVNPYAGEKIEIIEGGS